MVFENKLSFVGTLGIGTVEAAIRCPQFWYSLAALAWDAAVGASTEEDHC